MEQNSQEQDIEKKISWNHVGFTPNGIAPAPFTREHQKQAIFFFFFSFLTTAKFYFKKKLEKGSAQPKEL